MKIKAFSCTMKIKVFSCTMKIKVFSWELSDSLGKELLNL
jgi:hypothetical protein